MKILAGSLLILALPLSGQQAQPAVSEGATPSAPSAAPAAASSSGGRRSSGTSTSTSSTAAAAPQFNSERMSNDQVLKAIDDLEWRLKIGDIADFDKSAY